MSLASYNLIALRSLFIEFQGLREIFKSSNTMTRECIINDLATWERFSDSCFVPHFKPEEWSHGFSTLKDFLLLPMLETIRGSVTLIAFLKISWLTRCHISSIVRRPNNISTLEMLYTTISFVVGRKP